MLFLFGCHLLSRDVSWGTGNVQFYVAILTSMVLLFGLAFDVRCFGLKASNVGGYHREQGTFNYILVNGPELQNVAGMA